MSAHPLPSTPPPQSPPARLRNAGDAAVDRSLEEAKVMDRKGYPYLIHPLIDGIPRVDPVLLKAWVDWASGQTDLIDEATVIMAPEAMGLPLAAPLSLATGLPYVVVRKRKYELPGEEVAYCETGYGEACLHVNAVTPSDKVLIVDDVLSTGGTLSALIATLDGMKVPLVGALVFLDKGRVRTMLEGRTNLPIRAMRTIAIADGRVRILD